MTVIALPLSLRSRACVLAVAAALTGAAGCGLGGGGASKSATLTVSKAFGSARVRSISQAQVPRGETVLRMLERFFTVTTSSDQTAVNSISGIAGSSPRVIWDYYVNGIAPTQHPATAAVHRGDRIWWDLHDSSAGSPPAVVGSFPEPFIHGIGGKRLPTAVECAPDASSACAIVTSALASERVPVASQLLGTGSGSESIGVLVGTWRALRDVIGGRLIEQGPDSSGVYAHFTSDGARLELLDPRGSVRRRLGPGAGLIAATAQGSAPPTWFIAGTDLTGVLAAAKALKPARLHEHFALAVSAPGAKDFPIPVSPHS